MLKYNTKLKRKNCTDNLLYSVGQGYVQDDVQYYFVAREIGYGKLLREDVIMEMFEVAVLDKSGDS